MTCEIAIMNRHAIALAADSATTVTQWVEGRPQPHYFKGANKIFQLSNHHPVGMMIYDTATLQEVPWELLVKDFRKSLGDKSFNELEGYATELFNFVCSHGRLFPAEYQAKVFKDEAEKHGWMFVFGAQHDDLVKSAADDAAKKTALHEFFDHAIQEIEKQPVAVPFEPNDLDSALAVHKNDLTVQLEPVVRRVAPDLAPHVDHAQLAELSIRAILRNPAALMPSTGVVVAGFGDHDYFPSYREYKCCGLLLGKFISEKLSEDKITLERPAYINGFGTTSMVETFQVGYSPDVFKSVRAEFDKQLREFAERIRTEVGVADIPNLATHIDATTKAHTESWWKAARTAHYWPLIRIISALPVDEMSELAETLIALQSLKEKLTQPSESVGGPVDVAVVSKGDGFIWIKRKHYFDPKLNPRFFQRQASD